MAGSRQESAGLGSSGIRSSDSAVLTSAPPWSDLILARTLLSWAPGTSDVLGVRSPSASRMAARTGQSPGFSQDSELGPSRYPREVR